ncbi:hypothetical protein [Kordia sp.]
MDEITKLKKNLKQAEDRIVELEYRIDNLAKQLLHVFEINNLKNPYT